MDESHWKEAPFPIAAPDRLGTGSRFLRRLRGGSFDSWELNAERRNSKSAEFENVTPLLHLLLFPPPSSPSSSLLTFSSEPCMLLSRKGLMRCHRHRRLSPWIASLPRPPPIRRLARARYARPTTSLPSSPAMTAGSGPCRWSSSPFELACVGSVTRWVFFFRPGLCGAGMCLTRNNYLGSKTDHPAPMYSAHRARRTNRQRD